MIARYTREAMGRIWQVENRFAKMLEVEVSVAEVQAQHGLIPMAAADEIRQRGSFSVDRIAEIEKTTRHDVIAFVSNVAENVGSMGRFVHFGLTSSDVLDTAMSLQVREAGDLLIQEVDVLIATLKDQAKKYSATICAGRTHGMHAEPTTFGMKLSGFWAEMIRHRERLAKSLKQMEIVKLSGAVGTYATGGSFSFAVEEGVGQKLGLTPETVATQVIPRDRHAELIWSLSMIGAGIERLAVELRHLQRTEVGEVVEGFAKGQKGSSAMPHKKNPISAENLTGCARLLRSYAHAAMEDIALWHERDISHSSVERVIFPDAFILCDYAVHRATDMIRNIQVDENRMINNMNLSRGQLFSSLVLLALVEKGMSREEAYAKVQGLSHQLTMTSTLQGELKNDEVVKKLLSNEEIDAIFAGHAVQATIHEALKKSGVLS